MTAKHIHIVGCLPRSGTTLMTEIMINCFDIDAFTDHEYSIFKEFPRRYDVLCTKKPNDIKRVDYPLKVNPDLYVIYMLRDPRDAISSRSHKNNSQSKKIWGNLADWIRHHEIATSLSSHPRFITVKYEDLVTDPDKVQLALQQQLPFLNAKAKFSEYHLQASPSGKSDAALGGVRPISPVSIGNWRNAKSYLKAQLEKYGDITDILINLGYEKNEQWLNELEGVEPDNTEEPVKLKSAVRKWREKYITQPRRHLLYRLSQSHNWGQITSKLRHLLRQL
ncbi:sulfotransferase family protein [Methylophaga sp. OBS4]|uniref:sulfotransferase family protein n=1 Tax=Methylophaga sp. OBS4 TaxID=2991935 RepID=UPI0022548194|nr:sulfotransferase [Methylophaga sp. OBS4]MCX4187623.1 sulfotransferase [Methylophaga sp. OBS4]